MWQTSRSLTLTLTLAINPISSLNLNPIPNPIFRTYTQIVPSKLHSSRLFKKSKKDTLKEYVRLVLTTSIYQSRRFVPSQTPTSRYAVRCVLHLYDTIR